MTSPVVVELEEKLPDLTKIGDITVRDYVDAEIIVKVTPVQHRDVTFVRGWDNHISPISYKPTKIC